jgi:hypothetical protein
MDLHGLRYGLGGHGGQSHGARRPIRRGLLPTPQLRTAALLAVLRTEVTQRSAKEHHPMPDTVCLPATELINLDSMASVATAVWWCRLCGQEATGASRPAAHSDAVAHLTAEHHATIGIAP